MLWTRKMVVHHSSGLFYKLWRSFNSRRGLIYLKILFQKIDHEDVGLITTVSIKKQNKKTRELCPVNLVINSTINRLSLHQFFLQLFHLSNLSSKKLMQMKPITGILWFTLLIRGHQEKTRKQKPSKSRFLSSTKGEENKIEL